MPYSPTVWTDHVTMGNQVRMNNLEQQYAEATQSLPKDMYTPFVVTGIVTSKDGTNAKQLNVTAGTAFLKQTDGTLRRRDTSASTTNQFLTATPSTTYYLFLKNDGTWQWGTSASGPTNSLAIAQATTDASGNISVVSDQRTLATSLFTTFTGTVLFAPNVGSKPALWATLVNNPGADTAIVAAGVSGDTTPRVGLYTRSADSYGGLEAGAGGSITAHLYAQSGGWRITEGLTIDGTLSTTGPINTTGALTMSASNAAIEIGSVGVANTPFIDFHSSSAASDANVRLAASGGNSAFGSGDLNISSVNLKHNGNTVWDAANGGSGSGLDADTVDGVQASAFALLSGAAFTGAVSCTNITISGGFTATNANANFEFGSKSSSGTPFIDFNSSGFGNDNDVRIIASGGVNGASGKGTLSINAATLSISGDIAGNAACGIPMTRNGAATSKPVYTGTTTPTGDGVSTPATGAAWIKA